MAIHGKILDRALQLHQRGNLAEAEALYRQILQGDPTNAPALHLLGSLAHQTGHHDEAVSLIRQAIAVNPQASIFHFNLGLIHKKLGHWADAADCFRQALQLNPEQMDTSIYLGQVLIEQDKFAAAIACYREALRTNPNHVDMLVNMGNAYAGKAFLDEAEECYRAALRMDPHHLGGHLNLGGVLWDQGRLDEAQACFAEAERLEPAKPQAASNRLYNLNYHPAYDAPAIFAEHQRWEKQAARFSAPAADAFANERAPERRLRIGYVSPNFCWQAETFYTIPFFAAHDHQSHEIVLYADGTRADALTARLRSFADHWRNTATLTDQQLADLIGRDRIDILADLTMHMAGSRVLMFARKPAPVQVCWLGYQGTSGLTTFDCRVTDALVDPPGLFDSYYSEKSVRLPDAFFCYDPLCPELPTREPPALRNGYITFGSLHNFRKLNDDVLRLWAKAVGSVAHSRLLMLAPEGSRRRQIVAIFAQAGVAAERLQFLGKQPRPQYLELHHQFDIGLDTIPYAGQTTTLDSLWMGVPVLTLVGRTAVGRAGLNILQRLGLHDWITTDADAFAEGAVRCAGDLLELSRLRGSLRARLQQSPLMDGPRFARNMESLYRDLWRQWCAV